MKLSLCYRLPAILLLLSMVCVSTSTAAVEQVTSKYCEYGCVAVSSDGAVWIWGDGDILAPRQVPDISGAACAITINNGCAVLKTDGTVWVWDKGPSCARQVPGATGVSQIIVHGPGYALLKDDGAVWVGTIDGSPTCITTIDNVKEIAEETVLKMDGTVWVWCEVHGTSVKYFSEAKQVPGLTGIVSVQDNAGLKNDGTVWEWGIYRSPPYTANEMYDDLTPVEILGNVKTFLQHGDYAFAVKEDGTVWAWGLCTGGELGVGSTRKYAQSPVQINSMADVVSISCGKSHVLALKKDGSLWGWGSDRGCQLGVLPVGDITTPIQITCIDDIAKFYALGDSSYVIKNDGSLWAWGSNTQGELGDGTKTDPMAIDPKGHGVDTPVKVMINPGSINNSSFSPTACPGLTQGVDMTNLPTVTAQPAITVTPSASSKPSVTPTPVPLPSVTPEPTPGFGFTSMVMLGCVFVTVGVLSGFVRRKD